MSRQERLAKVFHEAFGFPVSDFSAQLGPDDVPKWDSIGHMNMVSLLEQEFGVQFELDDIMEMTTTGKILEILASKGVAS